MKFAELKGSLNQKLHNAYYIFGKDNYLMDSAMNMITKRCVKNFPDFNINSFNDENFDIEKVLTCCHSIPMCDEMKVVSVINAQPDKQAIVKLEKYLKSVNQSTCLIIKDNVNFNGYKAISNLCQNVDCDFLDIKMIRPLVLNMFKKSSVQIEENALTKLIEYCNFDMSFIVKEVKKLVSLCKSGQIVTTDIVDEMVHKNLEYSVFELSSAVCEKNKRKAIELLEIMLDKKESPQILLMLLISNFRRMFYTSVTSGTDKEIANLLDVKEYSIKMSRKLMQNFTPKQLKKVLDLGGKVDFDVKNGKIDEINAIYFFVSNIILM